MVSCAGEKGSVHHFLEAEETMMHTDRFGLCGKTYEKWV